MAINFPSSPSENDTYSAAGKTWVYVNGAWKLSSSTPNLGNSSVSEGMLQTGAVTAGKIGSEAVTEAKLGSGAVTVDKIGSGAVTAAKIGSGVVSHDKLANGLSAITVCTSSTRPGSPFTGQAIFETDTNRMKVWLGSYWSTGTDHSLDFIVEYLVVAGGGGAGGSAGTSIASGGGGAGGYRSSVTGESSGGGAGPEETLTLTTGTYTVTVGAGGNGGTAGHTMGATGSDLYSGRLRQRVVAVGQVGQLAML